MEAVDSEQTLILPQSFKNDAIMVMIYLFIIEIVFTTFLPYN